MNDSIDPYRLRDPDGNWLFANDCWQVSEGMYETDPSVYFATETEAREFRKSTYTKGRVIFRPRGSVADPAVWDLQWRTSLAIDEESPEDVVEDVRHDVGRLANHYGPESFWAKFFCKDWTGPKRHRRMRLIGVHRDDR